MLHTRIAAVKILPPSELAIFDAGRSDALKRLDRPQARAKLARARQLAAKYRAARPRSERVARKAVIFDELVARFQRRLEHLAAAEKRLRIRADRVTGAAVRPGG